MIDWIAIGLQLLASAMSLAGLWKIDDKSVWGQGVSLVAQVPWLVMNIYCGLWGLLPLNPSRSHSSTRATSSSGGAKPLRL